MADSSILLGDVIDAETITTGAGNIKRLRVSTVGGGGGGGGPVTIADCADVTQGCIADLAVGDAAGTVNAHVRQIAKLLAGNLTVIQPTGSLLNVQVSNFPATQPVSIAAAVDVSDRVGRLLGHVSIDAGTAVIGHIIVDSGSIVVTQTVGTSLHVNVDNFPATQPVSIAAAVDISDRVGRLVGVISGTVTANQGTANATPWNENVAQWGGAATTLGQKLAAASVPVVLASDQSAISVTSAPSFSTRSDTYTAPGNGVTVNVSTAPLKTFAIQVKGDQAPTSWDIRLEGSLDNVNFSQILQHTNTTGDGSVLWSGSSLTPILYFRSRVSGLLLGSATQVVVTILGT